MITTRPSAAAQAAAVTVRPATGADLKTWVRFPGEHVYDASSPWVPPLDNDLRRLLDRRRNPFFAEGDAQPYLALDAAGRPCGRILAQVYHRHNVRWEERTGFFGYFECVDQPEVAQALVSAAAQFAVAHGCDVLRGPFNMTSAQEMGILVDGYDQAPAIDQTYTAPYYPALLEQAGLTPVFPHSTFTIELTGTDAGRLLRDEDRALLAEGRLRFRGADLKAWDREVEILRDLINDSFYDNPHYVPLTSEEIKFQIGPYKRFLDPRISVVAELDRVPIGFLVAVPDYNLLLKEMGGRLSPGSVLVYLRGRSQIHDAIIIAGGVLRQWQGRGIMRILANELIRALQAGGYQRLHTTWVAPDNDKSLTRVVRTGGRERHRLTLYEMALDANV